MRLTKPWLSVADIQSALKGHLGVFQLADADQQLVYIGFAGGDSLYGLRGEVEQQVATLPGIAWFRAEVTAAYHTRYRELLMLHIADHGQAPVHNKILPPRLGRLSPAGAGA